MGDILAWALGAAALLLVVAIGLVLWKQAERR